MTIFTRLETLRLAMVTAKLDVRRLPCIHRNEYDVRASEPPDSDDGSYAYANQLRANQQAEMAQARGATPIPKGAWVVCAGSFAESDDDPEVALKRLEAKVSKACQAQLDDDIKTAREMLSKAEAAKRRLAGEG